MSDLADRPATEPRTKSGRKAAKYDPYWLSTILAIEAEAAQGAYKQGWNDALDEQRGFSEGAAPRMEWPRFEPGEACPDCKAVMHGTPCVHHEDWCPVIVEGAAPRAEGLHPDYIDGVAFVNRAARVALDGRISLDSLRSILLEMREESASRPSDERVP